MPKNNIFHNKLILSRKEISNSSVANPNDKNPKHSTQGYRQKFLDIYIKTGSIEEAMKVIKNPAFTRKIVEKWVEDYEEEIGGR